VGCSSSDKRESVSTAEPPAGTLFYLVDTEVSPTVVAAGETALVGCLATTGSGVEVKRLFTVSIAPEDGVRRVGAELTGQRAGTYEVACEIKDTEWRDASPAVFRVEPGAPAKVTATVAPSTIRAGESAEVTCSVEDRYGNVIPDAQTVVVASGGLAVDGSRVSTDKAGTYDIECEVVDAKVDSLPTVLEVLATEAVTFEAWAEPKQSAYAPGDVVEIRWRATDAFGNELDVDAETRALTPITSESGVHRFELEEQGYHRIEAVLAAPQPPLSDTVELLCDNEGPALRILSPNRGDTIQGTPGAPVIVKGLVTDASELAWVKLNGAEITPDSDGYFEVPMTPAWGLNIIVAEARDSLGQETRLTPTFYWSTAWLPHGEGVAAADVRIPGAGVLGLSQGAMDDGVHDPAYPNDLATGMELLLGLIDINALIPSLGIPPLEIPLPNVLNFEIPLGFGISLAIAGDLNVSVEVGTPQIGPPTVGIDSRDGGVDVLLGIGNDTTPAFDWPVSLVIEAPVVATLTLPSLFGGPPTLIPFELVGTSVISSGFQVQKAFIVVGVDVALSPGSELAFDLVDFAVDVEGVGAKPVTEAVIDFGTLDVPLLGQIPLQLDLVQIAPQLFDFVSQLSLDPLWALVEPWISGALQPVIASVIESVVEPLAGLLQLDIPLPLPSLLNPEETVELTLSVAPDTVLFDDLGGAFGLGVGLTAPKGIARQPLGMPLRGACEAGSGTTQPTVDGARDVQVGWSLDAFNALTFAFWWSGALEGPIDLSALGSGTGIPLDSLVVTPTFYLPAIVSDCGPEGSQLQLGDMYLEIEASVLGFTVTADVFLDLSMGIALTADAQGYTLTLGEFSQLDLEIDEVTGGFGGLFDIGELLEDFLIPFLTDSLPGTPIGPIPLPPLDLGALIPGVPSASIAPVNLGTSGASGRYWIGFDL
jgi:hypothetical protein